MECLRMCVVCRNMIVKSELIRFVKIGNSVEIDPSGKKDGRGAYLCKNEKCIEKAIKSNVFSKSFKQNIDKDYINESIKKYVAESKN